MPQTTTIKPTVPPLGLAADLKAAAEAVDSSLGAGSPLILPPAVPAPEPPAEQPPEPAPGIDLTQISASDTPQSVRRKDADFVVLSHGLGNYSRGDEITLEDLGPHASIDRLLSLGAIEEL